MTSSITHYSSQNEQRWNNATAVNNAGAMNKCNGTDHQRLVAMAFTAIV